MHVEIEQFENYSEKRNFFDYKESYSGEMSYKSSGF